MAALVNNVRLAIFANHLFNYPLPPNTEVIERTQEVGLFGNGNHCDFQAIQSMRTTLSQGQIEAYYEEVRLPRVLPFFEAPRQGDVYVFLTFDGTADGFLLFEAAVGDMGYSSDLATIDLRCN